MLACLGMCATCDLWLVLVALVNYYCITVCVLIITAPPPPQALLPHLDIIQPPAKSPPAPSSGGNLVRGPQAAPAVRSRSPAAEHALSEVDKTPQQRGQRSAGRHNPGDQSVVSKKLPAQWAPAGEFTAIIYVHTYIHTIDWLVTDRTADSLWCDAFIFPESLFFFGLVMFW